MESSAMAGALAREAWRFRSGFPPPPLPEAAAHLLPVRRARHVLHEPHLRPLATERHLVRREGAG